MTRSPESRTGPDDSVADVVLFLAFIAVVVSFIAPWAGLYVAAVCLSIIGVGLKIAAAIRHAGQRPPA
ncbi:hypothetical protein [Glycomyces tenuis]|uniref:hypothetical protein n=1 Tax=Glycomyces tenuis TaxID=58116 RepID=UPI00041C0B48|nr:hypothetical protein [Glycomyces tenuis]